jgi:hypothetical protein
MHMEASIMQFNSSTLVLDFIAYTKDLHFPKDRSPKELG